jgi:hypothetical protein
VVKNWREASTIHQHPPMTAVSRPRSSSGKVSPCNMQWVVAWDRKWHKTSFFFENTTHNKQQHRTGPTSRPPIQRPPTSETTKTHQTNPPRSYLSHVAPFHNIISYSIAIGLCFLDPKCCSAHENVRARGQKAAEIQ